MSLQLSVSKGDLESSFNIVFSGGIVHFELYTTKTVKQCSQELSARFLEKESRSRPSIGGFVEKGGAFNLTTSTPVVGLRRTTRLRATLEKKQRHNSHSWLRERRGTERKSLYCHGCVRLCGINPHLEAASRFRGNSRACRIRGIHPIGGR